MGDDGCFFIAVNYLLGQAGMQLTDKSQSMLVNISKKKDRGHDYISTKRAKILLKRLLIALPI
jgi:hypothetical protein